MANAFARFLLKFNTGDLSGPASQVVWAEASQTCPQVLGLLNEKNIQAVPVWDEQTKSFVGMVDVLDLLTLLVVMNTSKDFADLLASRPIDWEEFSAIEIDMFSNQQIRQVCDVSKRNPWCPVHFEVPLHSLMDMFGTDVNLHRVPVVNDAGDVMGLVTQSKVISFLAENVLKFPIVDTPISAWYTPSNSVVSVNIKEKTLVALQQLLTHNVSCVAIVNDDGKIINTLSASDIKVALGKSIFTDLNLPLVDFLAKSNAYFKRPDAPVVCSTADSIGSILSKLNDNHIHRIFVVDADAKPIGVLSLCNVISFLNINFVESA